MLTCPWCGRPNRQQAAYCGLCGRYMGEDLSCPACGAGNPPTHRFCDSCGSPLGGAPRGPGASESPVQVEIASVGGTTATSAGGPGGVSVLARPRPRLHVPMGGEALTAWLRRLEERPALARALQWSGVAVAAAGQLAMLSPKPGTGPPTAGGLALLVGLLLFGAGSLPLRTPLRDLPASSPPRAGQLLGRPWERAVAAVGVVMAVALALRLLRGSTAGWDLALWAGALGALAMPLLGRVSLPTSFLRRHRADLVAVALLMALFLGLNTWDLGHWRYSAIGDEYAFYFHARAIAEGQLASPFSQDGVYGKFPVLSSLYPAAIMRALGTDNFGWRMASVLAVVVSIPAMYGLAYLLAGRRVALLSTLLFASSHYLFGYAHTGYNSLYSLPPTLWAFLMFLWGRRSGSPWLLYGSGIWAGLGFYTFYASRSAAAVMALYALLRDGRRWWRALWPAAVGFAVTVFPLFLVSKGQVLGRMFGEVVGGYSQEISGPVVRRLTSNLTHNLPAFNYNPDVFHYTAGNLADPITAVAMVLGLGVVLRHLSRDSARFVLIWAAASAVATALLSPYPQVPISRMFYLVPVVCLLAAVALTETWESIAPSLRSLGRRRAGVLATALLGVAVLWLNAWQFWVATPRRLHLTPEAVAMGAIRAPECGGPSRAIVVARETKPLLYPALVSYYGEAGLPRLVDHASLPRGQVLDTQGDRCVVFTYPDAPEEREALDLLRRVEPAIAVSTFTDQAGKGRVIIATLPGTGL